VGLPGEVGFSRLEILDFIVDALELQLVFVELLERLLFFADLLETTHGVVSDRTVSLGWLSERPFEVRRRPQLARKLGLRK